MARRAVVLVSGGLDSTICVAIAKDQGFETIALSFDYQQRHRVELEAAQRVAAHYAVAKHYVFELGSFRALGGSALTSELAVPEARSLEEIGSGVPITYVPARNLIFLAHAVAVAEVEGAPDIFIGVNAVDYSGYPDCRPEFIDTFERTANLGTRGAIEKRSKITIHTPLISMSKAEIVLCGVKLGAPLHLTNSCYQPGAGGVACGRCDACVLRLRGFSAAGVADPVQYAPPRETP